MDNYKEHIKCPKCNKLNKVKVKSSYDSSNVIDIINRDIFKIKCPKCYVEYFVDYPIVVKGNNYIVYYKAGSTEDILDNSKEIGRVVDTFDNLKEKLLIFEDNLNDIVIEFIKTFLLNKIDDDIKKEVKDIRYDGKNEESLIFYLIGYNKSIGCTVDFYNNILKKAKIKKINKCIYVGEENYHKYFKLR